jgi:hypothetical protein
MLLSPEEGIPAVSPEHAESLKNSDYAPCANSQCNFHIAPDTQQTIASHQDRGYYTCPKCKWSADLLADEMPWHGADFESPGEWLAGGKTRIGLTMDEQGEIGEKLIQGLGSLPGYGPILWWHPGSANSGSPLDGATAQWGIEVKTRGFDATHHRFDPGRPVEREAKNREAGEMGLQGILGILVMLNFRTSMATIYVKEMPLEPWKNSQGQTYQGISSFRTNAGERLLEQVPFKNPFMDPHHPAPDAPAPQPPEDDLPF